MAGRVVTGTVHIIMARHNDTLANIGPVPNTAGNDSIRLEHEHPGYSTVFALLMASFANRKPVQIWVDEKEVNGENLMTLDWVTMVL
jgi:hypothetical protein